VEGGELAGGKADPSAVPNGSAAPAASAPPVVEEATAAPPQAAAAPRLKAPPASSLPTYDSSEASQYYTVAKTLLNEGDFETALTTIEEGIVATQALLPSPENGDDEGKTLHESMAPFHYLYGTTLLYSIEESVDPNQQMTNPTTGSNEPDGGSGGQPPPEEGGADEHQAVEDLQIAWENLETARTILAQLVQEHPDSAKLQADLAQVHLRCGDLQRQNSAYEPAITDYTACLSLRQNNCTISPWSRKIADVHYNLGLVYFNQVAETKLPEDDPEQAARVQKNLEAARSQAYYHFFECGKVFGGILAELCGADPDELLQSANTEIPNFKTTGEEEDNASKDHEHPKILGLKLENIRKLVSELTVPEAAQLDYNNGVAVLEEIQETIDEAENSEKGVHEATAMKEQISAAVAAQAEDDIAAAEGGSTTTTIGFGSAAAVASTAAAQPVTMVVKKKKRNVDEEGEDVKLPAKEPPKRHKSSE